MTLWKLSYVGLPLFLFASPVFALPNTGDVRPGCVFDDHVPIASSPYYMSENYGLGDYTVLQGAAVYVPAEPALTAQWLELQLEQELTRSAIYGTHESCHPNVRKVRTQVVSAGNGFWIVYIAEDERSADSLVRWSRETVASYKEERQIAQARVLREHAERTERTREILRALYPSR